MWVAAKAQLIQRGKCYVNLKPGDPVPEAEKWPNRRAYERQGLIKWVEDEAPKAPASVPLRPEQIVGSTVAPPIREARAPLPPVATFVKEPVIEEEEVADLPKPKKKLPAKSNGKRKR
jgi:hypothetical protein